MKRSLVIGTIRGIEIEVHISWLVVFALITWTMATTFFPQSYPDWSASTQWVLSAIIALLLFVSVLLHELSHSLVSIKMGNEVKKITLFIFGGVAHLEDEPDHPLNELKMAIAGPAMSIFLGLLLMLAANLLGSAGVPQQVIVPLAYMADVNLILAIFNLVPAFPLDGGRVLRAIIWHFKGDLRLATKIAASAGAFFGYMLIFSGVFVLLSGNFINGIWLSFIGWFIQQMSQASYQQTVFTDIFKNIQVKDFMTPEVVTVDYLQSVQELVDSYFYKYKYAVFPVLREGEVIGIVAVDQIKKLSRDSWPQTPIGKVTFVLTEDLVIAPRENVSVAMNKLFNNGIGRVLVMDRDQLLGIVSRTDILNYMRIRNQLDR